MYKYLTVKMIVPPSHSVTHLFTVLYLLELLDMFLLLFFRIITYMRIYKPVLDGTLTTRCLN